MTWDLGCFIPLPNRITNLVVYGHGRMTTDCAICMASRHPISTVNPIMMPRDAVAYTHSQAEQAEAEQSVDYALYHGPLDNPAGHL